jgi:hypothetical protein
MTKYFNAKVELIQTKTVWVQVSGDEAHAAALAKDQAQLKDPGFRATSVELKFAGESELVVGSRVVHRIFGPGAIEALYPNGDGTFCMRIKFDRGDFKDIHGPGSAVRPESLARGDQSPPVNG